MDRETEIHRQTKTETKIVRDMRETDRQIKLNHTHKHKQRVLE